jgi:hypothetical protein
MPGKHDPFPHRRNPDGTYDSICVTCFATIGSSRTEEELEIAEKAHVCDQDLLYERDAITRYFRPWKPR